VATFTLALPVGVLAMWLVRSGPGYAGGGLAFQPEFAFNSVYVAALAALATVLFALPVAYYARPVELLGRQAAERATYLGYAMPGVVLGLALVFSASTTPPRCTRRSRSWCSPTSSASSRRRSGPRGRRCSASTPN